tara:strand:+ start:328 stop:1338 length:1011 start_codon:yes stop_codon:yes gene_type:complete
MKSKGLSTGNILVYEKGEIIFQSSNGLRAIDPIDSLTLNSQFRLASVSKQFTSVAVMKLKQEGKLDYDQKVSSILNDFPHDNITIKHLLQHTSGIADYIKIINQNYVPQNSTKRNILGNNEILDIFYNSNPKLKFQPGEKYEYSNTGYLVLASIVEEVSKQHFREFLKENIFDPLNMNNTLLYSYKEGYDSDMPNRVFGYSLNEDKDGYEINDYHIVNDVRGDGGIYSTINDLFKWNMALLDYKVVPKKLLDEAWRVGTLNNGEDFGYGYGWVIGDSSKPKSVFHSGGWVGFVTYLYNEIDTKSGYVILTNDSSRVLVDIINSLNSIRETGKYVSK